jgi:hypothetical protein
LKEGFIPVKAKLDKGGIEEFVDWSLLDKTSVKKLLQSLRTRRKTDSCVTSMRRLSEAMRKQALTHCR